MSFELQAQECQKKHDYAVVICGVERSCLRACCCYTLSKWKFQTLIKDWNENDDFDCILEAALENPNHWHNEHVIVVNRELIEAVSSRIGFGCAQTSFYVFIFLDSIALITVRIPIWVMAPKPMWAVAPKPFVAKVYEILAGSSKGPLESRIPTQNNHHCSRKTNPIPENVHPPLNHRKK